MRPRIKLPTDLFYEWCYFNRKPVPEQLKRGRIWHLTLIYADDPHLDTFLKLCEAGHSDPYLQRSAELSAQAIKKFKKEQKSC